MSLPKISRGISQIKRKKKIKALDFMERKMIDFKLEKHSKRSHYIINSLKHQYRFNYKQGYSKFIFDRCFKRINAKYAQINSKKRKYGIDQRQKNPFFKQLQIGRFFSPKQAQKHNHQQVMATKSAILKRKNLYQKLKPVILQCDEKVSVQDIVKLASRLKICKKPQKLFTYLKACYQKSFSKQDLISILKNTHIDIQFLDFKRVNRLHNADLEKRNNWIVDDTLKAINAIWKDKAKGKKVIQSSELVQVLLALNLVINKEQAWRSVKSQENIFFDYLRYQKVFADPIMKTLMSKLQFLLSKREQPILKFNYRESKIRNLIKKTD